MLEVDDMFLWYLLKERYREWVLYRIIIFFVFVLKV